jgi:hypothetical protein
VIVTLMFDGDMKVYIDHQKGAAVLSHEKVES